MSIRGSAWIAWSVWSLCAGLAAVAVVLASLTPPGPTKSTSSWGVVLSVSLLVYPTVGAFIASRRPGNVVGWILCAIGFLLVVEGFALVYAGYALAVEPDSPPGERIALWVSGWFHFPMVFVGVALIILLFPNGRLLHRNWRAIPWLTVSGGLLWTLWLATKPGRPAYWLITFYPHIRSPIAVGGIVGDFFEMLGRLGSVALLMMCVASVIGVFVRLGSARGEERQQIKWFAYAAAVLLGVPFLAALPVAVAVEAMGGPWSVGLVLPVLAGLLGVPLAVGIAVLKYRLYNIDVIINRTLVYGSLTMMLALVYFGGVTVTQELFGNLTGQEEQSQLVIVATTLVIAALFVPLRRRIQAFIDRRFYRRKYDARKTLETFSARLRDETDLDALSDDLVRVVRETMQPAHVSLWLRRHRSRV
jgi:hypothetical protein